MNKGIYNIFKTILRKILSKKLLYKCEPILRTILFIFYKGENYNCKVCNKKLKSFIQNNNDILCPNCGSSSRDRRLVKILEEEYLISEIAILDFSPSRSVYRKLKKICPINYESSDLSGDFLADYKYNITEINVKANKYDLIICYHVLEHVVDDNKAISELYRVLKNDGACLIQTPFKSGDIFEDYSINTDEGRLKYFGQRDHVRIYSLTGLKERLYNHGFKIEVMKFIEERDNYYGFSNQEYVLKCKKS